MNEAIQARKRVIRWVLGVVLALDLVLLLLNLRPAASPQEQRLQEDRLQRQHDLLAADVRRATEIQQRLPQVQRECDEFFGKELREASTGYSSIVADLGALAREAGLHTSAVTFRQHDVSNRAVVEVEVTTTVEGDYPSLVSFINGLERSRNFYLLDSLQLASSTAGSLKLNLQLRTYFRS
jgi:Tfp pilus assembly protein PilO